MKPTIRMAGSGDREMVAHLWERETRMFRSAFYASAWFWDQFACFEPYRLRQVVIYALKDNSTVKRIIRGHAEAICIGGSEEDYLHWIVLGVCVEKDLNPELVKAFIKCFIASAYLPGQFYTNHKEVFLDFKVSKESQPVLYRILVEDFQAECVATVPLPRVNTSEDQNEAPADPDILRVSWAQLGITNGFSEPLEFDGPLKLGQ